MATQQHYLAEISEKLERIASGIEELLERDDDDKRGTLVHVDNTVARSRERLEEHGSLSASRIQELRDGARDASRVWHQLRGRFRATSPATAKARRAARMSSARGRCCCTRPGS